jgi:fructokinase
MAVGCDADLVLVDPDETFAVWHVQGQVRLPTHHSDNTSRGQHVTTDYLGGIEGGGTKFICSIAEHPTAEPEVRVRIDTTTPDETLGKMVRFFVENQERYPLRALGVASFGPVDLRVGSATYGYITETPKPGWRNADVLGALRSRFDLPIGFDLDVNAAALGEWAYGAGQGLDVVEYITVGTGIGGGGILNGQMLHGLIHPEMGHLLVRRHPDDTYVGCCPYHQDCLEGLACGKAIEGRWGTSAFDKPGHVAWIYEAYYLAQAIASLLYILSPQRIIMGGSVMMRQLHLFSKIHVNVQQMLNGYLKAPAIIEHPETLVVPPKFGDFAGAIGALELARRAAETD